MLPPEWIMEVDDLGSYYNFVSAAILSVFCAFCGCAITPPYTCCWKEKFYFFSSIRIGISLMEWIILIIVGILVEYDVIKDTTKYLFVPQHCLNFFIVFLIFYFVYTFFPYLMPDLRLPAEISIRSMCGYAFLGEITELERLNKSNILRENDNINYNSNIDVWDTPANDIEFLGNHFYKEFTNVLSALGYHSFVLLQIAIRLDDTEIDLLYQTIRRVYPKFKIEKDTLVDSLTAYRNSVEKNEKGMRTYRCNNKLPAIFALANKQYETLKWLESNGAKQHIWLFKNRDEKHRTNYQTMGFEWARMLLQADIGDHGEKYQF